MAEAGFFSSFLGDQAYAETETTADTDTIKPSKPSSIYHDDTALLQAKISLASIPQDKNDKKDNQIDENVNVDVSNSALVPKTSAFDGTDGTDSSSCGDINVYKVIENDSISKVAKLLDVPENNVLIANDMKKKLVKDDVLFIPDVPGLEHTVAKGQTLQSIAKRYKANINDIAFCNGIAPDAKLKIGYKLMIPDGYMADDGGDKPAPNLSSSIAKDINYYITYPIRELVGYFKYPLPFGIGRKTQGLHGPGKRGIDYGAPKGTPIYASAKGIVNITCAGWCGAYGTMAIIEHPDKDTKTLYAHMSKIVVNTGDQVAQGQTIGYVGNTGRSTGPHLHIEVFYAKHPGVDNSWVN